MTRKIKACSNYAQSDHSITRNTVERIPYVAGLDFSAKNSPFGCACASGNLELLYLLIERGLKLDDRLLFVGFDCLDESDLDLDKCQHIAAALIRYIKDPTYNERGYTFLHRVCSIGDADNAKAVLKRGVDRDALTHAKPTRDPMDFVPFDSDSVVALDVAAANGHVDVVKLLLEWDNVPIEMYQVDVSMIEAAKYGELEVVKCFVEYGAGCRAEALLETMESTGSFDVAEYLLNNGASVDGRMRDITPLLALIRNNRKGYLYPFDYDPLPDEKVRTAQLLLDRGASCDATTYQGDDALKLAVRSGLPEIVQLILNHDKGKPISVDRLNESLLVSLERAMEEIIWCLLDHGAHVDTLGNDGYTPLLLLCSKSYIRRQQGERRNRDYDVDTSIVYLPTIQLLLGRGADTNVVSQVSGQTALLYAGEHAITNVSFSLKLSTLLLEHGADVNQGNATTGNSPLMMAAYFKRPALVQLYLSYDADVMQVNDRGQTVFDMMGDKPEYAKVVELCTEHLAAKPLLK